jgi:hypothetical protein
MIDSLHSLTRNPLPAITALNLRSNRLQSIAGIERLYPLERLDLRDNRLTDPMELARLTGIPEIREIWVEGNPFTRTHRDYRITIFNLFRNTPGYTEDITIDASGPTYSEKRYLVERAMEPPAVPVVKPPAPEIPAVDVSKPAIIYDAPKEPAVLRKERPTPKTASSEVNTTSTRRRRAPKRRIVDLATNDTPIPHPRPVDRLVAGPLAPSDSQEGNYRISSLPDVAQDITTLAEVPVSNIQDSPVAPRLDTTTAPQLVPAYSPQESQLGWTDTQNWDVGGELYRRKIEALRDTVGPGYLSVLSEEGWESPRPPNYHDSDYTTTSPLHSNPNTPRAASIQAIHSGRTLG